MHYMFFAVNHGLLERSVKDVPDHSVLEDNRVVCSDVNCPGPTPSSVDVALAEMLDLLGLTQLVGSPMCDSNLLDIWATDHKRRRQRRGSHLRSPHRHRQRHCPQPEADSRLHVETTPESRPVNVRVRDPSERAVYQPSRRDRRLR